MCIITSVPSNLYTLTNAGDTLMCIIKFLMVQNSNFMRIKFFFKFQYIKTKIIIYEKFLKLGPHNIGALSTNLAMFKIKPDYKLKTTYFINLEINIQIT